MPNRWSLEEFGRELDVWVATQSPSRVKSAVDRFGESVATAFVAEGCSGRRHANADLGDHWELTYGDAGVKAADGYLLILGHLDTVYPLQTLAPRLHREGQGSEQRWYGPGALDMKGGILAALYALRLFKSESAAVGHRRGLKFLWVSDEEIGSPSSRSLTERLARGADAVLVLEFAADLKGALKTARKGIAGYRLNVEGRAAHAGVDPTLGASAIAELARQIVTINDWQLPEGVTINPGVIEGGTKANVVAQHASLELDVRAWRASDLREVDSKLRALAAMDKRVRLDLQGGVNRPPMERSAAIGALFARAAEVGRGLGIELREAATGGASDGNFTAALGIPTLDGLGMCGAGAHSADEHILAGQIESRVALLAALLRAL